MNPEDGDFVKWRLVYSQRKALKGYLLLKILQFRTTSKIRILNKKPLLQTKPTWKSGCQSESTFFLLEDFRVSKNNHVTLEKTVGKKIIGPLKIKCHDNVFFLSQWSIFVCWFMLKSKYQIYILQPVPSFCFHWN